MPSKDLLLDLMDLQVSQLSPITQRLRWGDLCFGHGRAGESLTQYNCAHTDV